jgi:hypothetical protein
MKILTMSTSEYRHLFTKAQDAHKGGYDAWRAQSTGEKLAVAMVLNKADWLAELDYTMAEAIDRIGPEWLANIPSVAKELLDT